VWAAVLLQVADRTQLYICTLFDYLGHRLFDLPQYLINPNQSSVHDLLTGSDRRRRDLIVRAVPAFSHCFYCWKILVVAVSIAEEE
jgi:hypothetical protein